MGNYSINLDLKKFNKSALVNIQGKTGKVKCIVIPVDENPEIHIGEKGVYLNLTAIELSEVGKYGDTHLVKGNLPSEIYSELTDEQRKALPILGNMKPLERKPVEMEPQGEVEVEDDLPF